MKKSVSVLVGAAFILSFNLHALADEGHSHSDGEKVLKSAETFKNGDNKESTDGMEGMDHSNMEGMDHSNMDGMDHSNMEGMDHSDMEGMDHSKMEGMDHGDSGTADSGHSHGDSSGTEESGGHSDGGHSDGHSHGDSSATEETGGHNHGGGPVIETPPNMKILGTFGGINLSFILIGVWNKWFRRKGEQ